MARPCLHADLLAGCHWCDLYQTNAAYRAKWDGTPAPPSAIPCAHLGDPTGEVRECESCGGNVRLKVMACKIHGVCTPARPVAGLAFCGTCPDRTPHFPSAPPPG